MFLRAKETSSNLENYSESSTVFDLNLLILLKITEDLKNLFVGLDIYIYLHSKN